MFNISIFIHPHLLTSYYSVIFSISTSHSSRFASLRPSSLSEYTRRVHMFHVSLWAPKPEAVRTSTLLLHGNPMPRRDLRGFACFNRLIACPEAIPGSRLHADSVPFCPTRFLSILRSYYFFLSLSFLCYLFRRFLLTLAKV